MPEFVGMGRAFSTTILVAIFVLIEWNRKERQYALAGIEATFKRPVRWALYAFVIFLIGMYMQTKETPFIYFQF